jgi:hypothetical protein
MTNIQMKGLCTDSTQTINTVDSLKVISDIITMTEMQIWTLDIKENAGGAGLGNIIQTHTVQETCASSNLIAGTTCADLYI